MLVIAFPSDTPKNSFLIPCISSHLTAKSTKKYLIIVYGIPESAKYCSDFRFHTYKKPEALDAFNSLIYIYCRQKVTSFMKKYRNLPRCCHCQGCSVDDQGQSLPWTQPIQCASHPQPQLPRDEEHLNNHIIASTLK